MQSDTDIHLVTMAGNEHIMRTNLAAYEDLAQLEHDVICFLPTVSDLNVFGCQADLIDFETRRPLTDDFHTVLLQQRKLQIIVRPCQVDGHSIWQFQDDGSDSYPRAVHVPLNPRKTIADRAFYAAPMLRHVEVAPGIAQVGFAAWQSCEQLLIVKLPPSVTSLGDGAFQGCYALREVEAPGCVQYCRRAFAECCSLISVGVGQAADGSIMLAPGAQLGQFAFESCLLLKSITFPMDCTSRQRSLPGGVFCGAGITNLYLPSDFQSIGQGACENCKRLIEVNLLSTEIHALLRCTFAHCEALACVWLPPRLTSIGKEAFLRCTALQEIAVPVTLREIGIRAFFGCEQLRCLTPSCLGEAEMTATAESNAFLLCEKFELATWIELLPTEGPDSDAFDEELRKESP